MKTKAIEQKLKAVRDFGTAALFTGASIFYYHATMPEDNRAAENPAAAHAFVDANPIRLHWLTAAFKQPEAAEKQVKPQPQTKGAFLDEKPIRLGHLAKP